MRLLLDTHIAIWAVLGDAKLSRTAESLIADPDNDVAVSMVSIWEIAIKNNLRRSAAPSIGITTQDAIAQFSEATFDILGLTTKHTLEVERLPHMHGDPFDRMLVAQARVETFRLVTHDKELAEYGDHVFVV